MTSFLELSLSKSSGFVWNNVVANAGQRGCLLSQVCLCSASPGHAPHVCMPQTQQGSSTAQRLVLAQARDFLNCLAGNLSAWRVCVSASLSLHYLQPAGRAFIGSSVALLCGVISLCLGLFAGVGPMAAVTSDCCIRWLRFKLQLVLHACCWFHTKVLISG